MNESLLFQCGMLVGGVSTALIGAAVCWKCADGARLAAIERWPRNRPLGMFLGWAALLWCIPHAEVVAPGFLQPLLLPLALVIPVLSYFFLDYLLARSVAGLMILFAYFIVHGAFEQHAKLAVAATVTAWIFGIAGIWVSGKPCAMRDWLRKCCRSVVWRRVSGAVLGAFGLIWILCGVWR